MKKPILETIVNIMEIGISPSFAANVMTNARGSELNPEQRSIITQNPSLFDKEKFFSGSYAKPENSGLRGLAQHISDIGSSQQNQQGSLIRSQSQVNNNALTSDRIETSTTQTIPSKDANALASFYGQKGLFQPRARGAEQKPFVQVDTTQNVENDRLGDARIVRSRGVDSKPEEGTQAPDSSVPRFARWETKPKETTVESFIRQNYNNVLNEAKKRNPNDILADIQSTREDIDKTIDVNRHIPHVNRLNKLFAEYKNVTGTEPPPEPVQSSVEKPIEQPVHRPPVQFMMKGLFDNYNSTSRKKIITETIGKILFESNRARRQYTKKMKDLIFQQMREPDLRSRSVNVLGGVQERDPIFGDQDRMRGFDQEAAAYGGPIPSETLPTGHPSAQSRGPLERFSNLPYAFPRGMEQVPSKIQRLSTMDYHYIFNHPSLEGKSEQERHKLASDYVNSVQFQRMQYLPNTPSQMFMTPPVGPKTIDPEMTGQQSASLEKEFMSKRPK